MSRWGGHPLSLGGLSPTAATRVQDGEVLFDYDIVDPAELSALFQARTSSADDFTPTCFWNFDEGSGAATDYGGSVRPLQPQASATRVASDHGSAGHQGLGNGAEHWRIDSNFALNFGTSAFAFAARVRFNAVGSGSFWLSKGSSSSYYGAGLDGTGKISVLGKPIGLSVASAQLPTSYADGEWRWVLLGRTVTEEKLWIATASELATTAFTTDKDVSNNAVQFGLWFNLFGTPGGGGNVDVDHLIAWTGAAAENVYAHRLSLFWEDPISI